MIGQLPVSIVDLHFQGVHKVIAAFLFESNGELGLIETGPTTSLPVLLDALEKAGGLDRLTSVVVTHVHLDHAAAVGTLLRKAPNAKCYVHSVGAPHLVDPSRLLKSAGRIYGDQMESLWGEVLPAPEANVVAVDDGDSIRIGDVVLDVVYTPGHASHHIALFHGDSRSLFTGDMAGVRIEGFDDVRPPAPPPDIDVELWHGSVDRVTRLNPSALYLTHFGRFSSDVSAHFDRLMRRLDQWSELVHTAIDEGQYRAAIVDRLQRSGNAELIAAGANAETIQQYDLGTPYGMTVDGLVRYWEKHAGATDRGRSAESRERASAVS